MKISQDALNKELKDVKGAGFPIQYPTDADRAKLPDDADGKPDTTKFPMTTVRHCVFDCLRNYETNTRKEGHYVNLIAHNINDTKAGEFELKDKLIEFLKLVMEDGIMRVAKKKQRGPDGKEFENEVSVGLYKSFLIDQAMGYLGYAIEDDK